MHQRPKRLVTAHASTELSTDVQKLLWNFLDDFLSKSPDPENVQIFYLTASKHKGITVQAVTHEQGRPLMVSDEDLFVVTKPHNGTIWIYLESDRQTMLLPEDW